MGSLKSCARKRESLKFGKAATFTIRFLTANKRNFEREAAHRVKRTYSATYQMWPHKIFTGAFFYRSRKGEFEKGSGNRKVKGRGGTKILYLASISCPIKPHSGRRPSRDPALWTGEKISSFLPTPRPFFPQRSPSTLKCLSLFTPICHIVLGQDPKKTKRNKNSSALLYQAKRVAHIN